MKPIYKGIGTIALATGATVLAISLLGSKQVDNNQKREASPASEVNEAVVQENTNVAVQQLAAVVKTEQAVVTANTGTGAANTLESAPAASEKPVQAPPPPGLFREAASSAAVADEGLKAPVAPAPLGKPQELATGVPVEPQPVVAQDMQVPAAPELNIQMEAQPEAPVPPQMNEVTIPEAPIPAEATVPVKPASTEISITPPPMPDLGDLKGEATPAEPAQVTQAPEAPAAPTIEAPSAPVLETPALTKPAEPDAREAGVRVYQNRPYGKRPGPGPSTMRMPPMRMPMQMGSPEMNQMMGGNTMMPVQGYMPGVYYVPVPVYPYGQPYMPMPYGYPVPPRPVQHKPSLPKEK